MHDAFFYSLYSDFNINFFFCLRNFSLEKVIFITTELDSSINHSCMRNLDNALELYVFDGGNRKKSNSSTLEDGKIIFLE